MQRQTVYKTKTAEVWIDEAAHRAGIVHHLENASMVLFALEDGAYRGENTYEGKAYTARLDYAKLARMLDEQIERSLDRVEKVDVVRRRSDHLKLDARTTEKMRSFRETYDAFVKFRECVDRLRGERGSV